MGLWTPLRRFYAYEVLISLCFFAPVIILFQLDRGLSFTQIMLLSSWYTLICIALTVPVGALADHYGRGKFLVAGPAITTMGAVAYGLAHTFPQFLLGETLFAVGFTFIFNTDRAFIYDALVRAGREADAKRMFIVNQSNCSLGYGLACIFGGVLGSVNLAFPMLAFAVPQALAAVIALGFSEPSSGEGRVRMRDKIADIRDCFGKVKADRQLTLLIINSGLVASVIFIAQKFYQPQMQAAGIPIAYFGVIFAAVSILGALVVRRIHAIEERVGMKRAILLSGLIPAYAMLVLAGFSTALVIVAAITLINTLHIMRLPLFSDYINKRIPSDRRATMLSLEGLSMRVSFIILSPILGYTADKAGLTAAYVLLALTLIVTSLGTQTGKEAEVNLKALS